MFAPLSVFILLIFAWYKYHLYLFYLSISNVKLPKSLIKKVDANVESKSIIKAAIETVKKAKVAYAF
jgi:hypothetical protein